LRTNVPLATPPDDTISDVQSQRQNYDSKYAALYHPWIEILDPTERATQGATPRRIDLPPSGFVAGIYARSDIERGVFKAPANEVVRGLDFAIRRGECFGHAARARPDLHSRHPTRTPRRAGELGQERQLGRTAW
jgi:hypothetical protein